jgi:hypothetical protein
LITIYIGGFVRLAVAGRKSTIPKFHLEYKEGDREAHVHEWVAQRLCPQHMLDTIPQRPGPLEELKQEAEQHGVGKLYNQLVSALEAWFRKRPTKSGLSFDTFGNSQKAVFSLLPGKAMQRTAFGISLIRSA